MALDELRVQIPTWAVVALLAAVGLSFVYGIVIMGSLTRPLVFWSAMFRFVLSLVVVYLFYRFVLAVESIAENY